MSDERQTPKPQTGGQATTADPIPTVDSAALLQGGRCALILHHGVAYRLRATRSGKLILTK